MSKNNNFDIRLVQTGRRKPVANPALQEKRPASKWYNYLASKTWK